MNARLDLSPDRGQQRAPLDWRVLYDTPGECWELASTLNLIIGNRNVASVHSKLFTAGFCIFIAMPRTRSQSKMALLELPPELLDRVSAALSLQAWVAPWSLLWGLLAGCCPPAAPAEGREHSPRGVSRRPRLQRRTRP